MWSRGSAQSRSTPGFQCSHAVGVLLNGFYPNCRYDTIFGVKSWWRSESSVRLIKAELPRTLAPGGNVGIKIIR
jgi:hypothetical protein